MVAWPVAMIRGMWLEYHACYGGPCGLWQDAALKSPLKPRPRINLAQAYRKRGMYTEAVAEFQNALLLSYQPHLSDHEAEVSRLFANMNLSSLYLDTGHFQEAHEILVQAWLADPGFPGYAVNLSVFYLNENQPEKAVVFLTNGIENLHRYSWFVDKGKLYLNRGEAFRFLGACDLAEADYAEARRLDYAISRMTIPQC